MGVNGTNILRPGEVIVVRVVVRRSHRRGGRRVARRRRRPEGIVTDLGLQAASTGHLGRLGGRPEAGESPLRHVHRREEPHAAAARNRKALHKTGTRRRCASAGRRPPQVG